MAITIGSNISSLLSQRQLGRTSSELATVNLRLASGSRINSAADDAAGLAISLSLNVDTRVFTQALRNLNDGASYLNIADSAVGELASVVIRQRELASQSANGTYGAKQREALDREAQALSSEYFRIARTTSFNGIKLFDGSNPQVVLQAGYGDLGTISSSLGGKMGDGTFQSQYTVVATSSTHDLRLGDVNNDGKLDIVGISESAGMGAAVLLGNGNGSFAARVTYALGNSGTNLELVDLNGDGNLDIVSSNINGLDNVTVTLGNGNGSFNAPNSFGSGNSPRGLKVVDVTSDGVLDIVISNDGSGTVGVLRGNGDGSFSAQVCYSSSEAFAVQSGDFNGDGKVDLVSGGNTMRVLLSNGDGSFQAPVNYDRSGANGEPDFEVADYTGDGILDIAVSGNSLTIFSGNGDGTFKHAFLIPAVNAPFGLDSNDFNGDGIRDLVVASRDTGEAKVFLGNGDGSFGAASIYVTGNGPRYVETGDLNGDGITDFATSNFHTDTISIFFGNTRDGIGPQQPFSLATRQGALASLEQFDRNLSLLSQQRATIGAFQSRITSAIAALQTSRENYAAAESRIKDTDIAQESASLTRLSILQRVGSAVLAQANQQPQLALQLLAN